MRKRRPFITPITAARPRYTLSPSRPNKFFMSILKRISPFYIRFALKVTGFSVRKPETIIQSFKDVQEKKIRLILAFRHPYGDEPQILSHFFDVTIDKLAKQLGTPLPKLPHARFVHSYDVALWGDALIRWVLPTVGAVPVYHIKFDAPSLRQIRKVLKDDEYPLALAPEGQVTYFSELLPRVEQGTARMGFWCVHDLHKAGRDEKVLILPISVHYQYDKKDTKHLEALISRTEKQCGLIVDANRRALSMPQRLNELESAILEQVESAYRITYHYTPPEDSSKQVRWASLMETSLQTAENLLHIFPKDPSDLVNRVYHIRSAGWDRVYPTETIPKDALGQALADRRAGEGWYAMRHMEFVDMMYYFNDKYVNETDGKSPSYDRIVEMTNNLAELVSRLMGGNFSNRPNLIKKHVVILPATPIELTERRPAYEADAREAIQQTTNDLEQAFLACIKEYQDEQGK